MPPRRAVYTALLGRYEELNEQPTALDTDIPFICFTDDPDLVSETWQIHLVDPLFPLDMVRSQRDIKIRGHETLTQFDETLYIDNSVSLKQVPDIILDEWLASTDLAVSLHSFRDRVVDEFDEVIALSLDDPSRVHEQLMYYAHLYPEVLSWGDAWPPAGTWRAGAGGSWAARSYLVPSMLSGALRRRGRALGHCAGGVERWLSAWQSPCS